MERVLGRLLVDMRGIDFEGEFDAVVRWSSERRRADPATTDRVAGLCRRCILRTPRSARVIASALLNSGQCGLTRDSSQRKRPKPTKKMPKPTGEPHPRIFVRSTYPHPLPSRLLSALCGPTNSRDSRRHPAQRCGRPARSSVKSAQMTSTSKSEGVHRKNVAQMTSTRVWVRTGARRLLPLRRYARP